MITRICPICGIRFEASVITHRYCSRRCTQVARRRKNAIMTEFPDMPPHALDLQDMACIFRHTVNETLALGSVSPPEVAIICNRVADKIAAVLDEEGL